MLSKQDEIWNRAALEGGGSNPAAGDVALASLLVAHGVAMNGGVLHAIECLTDAQRAAAARGFVYFGFPQVAALFTNLPSNAEGEEESLNEVYWASIPDDSILVEAFRMKLLASPEAFSCYNNGGGE
jgi:hypothetical protein